MMKFKLLFIACTALLLSACSKEEFFSQDEANSSESTALIGIPVSKGPRAGLYVSRFDSILGDTAKENPLLRWAKKEGFNSLYLYGVSGIITSSASRALLNTFVGKAKAAPFYFTISFVAASDATANNYYNLYYTSIAYPNKFNAINTEYEYWNCDVVNQNTFYNFLPLLNAVHNINQTTTTPKVGRNIYVSNFTDANGFCYKPPGLSPVVYSSTGILTELISKNDKLLLTNYHTNAGTTISPILVTKLNDLSAQANAMGTIVNVEILYNVRTASSSPNIYNYFSTTGLNNSFVTAFNNFITNYNASTVITNKLNLRIVGYSTYRYQEAKLARP
jgi:hypothetical protein